MYYYKKDILSKKDLIVAYSQDKGSINEKEIEDFLISAILRGKFGNNFFCIYGIHRQVYHPNITSVFELFYNAGILIFGQAESAIHTLIGIDISKLKQDELPFYKAYIEDIYIKANEFKKCCSKSGLKIPDLLEPPTTQEITTNKKGAGRPEKFKDGKQLFHTFLKQLHAQGILSSLKNSYIVHKFHKKYPNMDFYGKSTLNNLIKKFRDNYA